VLPIKEKESGWWATPNTMDYLPPRSKEGTMRMRQTHKKGRSRPSNLREQVDPTTMRLWRTPDAVAGGSNLPGIKKALDQGHLKRPSGQPIQIRLHDQIREPRLWPTPRASNPGSRPNQKGGKILQEEAKKSQPTIGGTLNPVWVEWLMGFKEGHTDLKDWEMLLSRKSRKKLAMPSSKQKDKSE
tara:strand:- start:1618 stop:2172 length:555 start_codon:yes stop_codon:yes gene_type:complete